MDGRPALLAVRWLVKISWLQYVSGALMNNLLAQVCFASIFDPILA